MGTFETYAKPLIRGGMLTRGMKRLPYRQMKQVLNRAHKGRDVTSLLDTIGLPSHEGTWK